MIFMCYMKPTSFVPHSFLCVNHLLGNLAHFVNWSAQVLVRSDFDSSRRLLVDLLFTYGSRATLLGNQVVNVILKIIP
jgi:hypothetical protein